MSDNSEHCERLRQLGLLDADDGKNEIRQLEQQSEALEADYNLLAPLVQSFAERVDECREAERFLAQAVRTAESADLSECREKVNEALSAQEEALVRVQACEQQLRSELSRLPERKRQQVQRFLGSSTATRTSRQPLETTIDDTA